MAFRNRFKTEHAGDKRNNRLHRVEVKMAAKKVRRTRGREACAAGEYNFSVSRYVAHFPEDERDILAP